MIDITTQLVYPILKEIFWPLVTLRLALDINTAEYAAVMMIIKAVMGIFIPAMLVLFARELHTFAASGVVLCAIVVYMGMRFISDTPA